MKKKNNGPYGKTFDIGILDFIWYLDFVICLSRHSLPTSDGPATAETLLVVF